MILQRILPLLGSTAVAEAGAFTEFAGAQLKMTGNHNNNNATVRAAVAFDAAQFDTDGFWSAGSPTKLIIPAKWNNHWAVLRGVTVTDNVANTSDSTDLQIVRGGAAFSGMGRHRSVKGVGAMGTNNKQMIPVTSHPVQLTTAQEFELQHKCLDGNVDYQGGQCSFSIEILGPTFIGCVLKNAADLTGKNLPTFPTIPFDTEVVDDDGAGGGFHTSGSPTQIKISAAVNGRLGVLRATISVANIGASNNLSGAILKNGSGIGPSWREGAQSVNRTGGSDTGHWLQLESRPFLLVTDDVYELQNGASTGQATNATWEAAATCFSLEVLPVTTQNVLCRLNTDKTTQNHSTATAIGWDGADLLDVAAGAHDPASNNTQIIIPSSLNGKKAVFTGQLISNLQTASTTQGIDFQRSAAAYDGMGGFNCDVGNFGDGYINASSNIAELATGQVYTMRHHNSDTSVTLAAGNCTFGMRVLGP